MIGFFPKAYPDELLYSQICRYHVRSGNGCYRSTADEIYAHGGTVRPDPEFLNRFTDDALQWITKGCSIEQIIQEHTMFPAYGRFLPKERRRKAFEALCKQEGNFYGLTSADKIPSRFPRYCPVCSKEDRDRFGETYWHRAHHIRFVDICPVHKCYLENVDDKVWSRTSLVFCDAEHSVPLKTEARSVTDLREIELADYMIAVLQEDMDLTTEYPIGQHLHDRLSRKYVFKSGLVRNMRKLNADIQAFYGNQSQMDIARMQSVFNGHRFNYRMVCELALFEGISTYDLTHLPMEYMPQGIDALYLELAEKYSIDRETVKAIGSETLTFMRKKNAVRNAGPLLIEWQMMDDQYLPEVKRLSDEIYHKEGRPEKVTAAAIAGEMKIPPKRFERLPKCKAYIDRYRETSEEYWARKIVWALREIQKEKLNITQTRLMKKTNIKKQDILASVHYIKDEAYRKLVQKAVGEIDA